MKKLGIALLMLTLLATTGASASSIEGNWQGSATVSGVPFSLSVNASFAADGTFSASMIGLSASGWYSESDGALTMSIGSLDGFLASRLVPAGDIGSVRVPLSIGDDDTLSISADVQGLSGSLTLKRK